MSWQEVLTLQFGGYANFVGAHYWNIQDELLGYTAREDWQEYANQINMGQLFSMHEDKMAGTTYKPRAIMFDASGSLGGVSYHPDALQHSPAAVSVASWGGAVEVHRAAAVPKSEFVQQLEHMEHLGEDLEDAAVYEQQQSLLEAAAQQLSSVQHCPRYWTDYLKVMPNPHYVFQVPGIRMGMTDLDSYGDGHQFAADSQELCEDMVDRVRHMMEACDHMQGLQVLVEDTSGWGALAARVLQEVQQEAPRAPVLLFAVRKPSTARAGRELTRSQLSEALALSQLASLASLYVPMTVPWQPSALPHLRHNPANAFHSSAILAAAIDSATSPFRLTEHASPLGLPVGATDLHSLVRLLTGSAANLAAAHLLLPAPHLPADLQQLQQQLDARAKHPHSLLQQGSAQAGSGDSGAAGGEAAAPSPMVGTAMAAIADMACLMPGVQDVGTSCLAESITVRGARTAAGPAGTPQALAALDSLLLQQPRRCVQHRCVAAMPLPVPLPFPRIFAPTVNTYGDVSLNSAHAQPAAGSVSAVEVSCAPVMTKLSASKEFEGCLRQLHRDWRTACASVAGRAMLEGWGVEQGEVEGVTEVLEHTAGLYSADSDFDEFG